MNHKWTNPRGNICELKSYVDRTIDYYKNKFQNTNWDQLVKIKYDSDTHIWINLSQLKVMIFKLGAEIMIACNNLESFNAELGILKNQ